MLALRTHYTHAEEADQARRALDALKMTRGTSARVYIQKFNTLLDDINNMSVADILYAFTKGLPEDLQMWIRHDATQTLQDAQDLMVRMSNSEPQPLASAPAGPEPMQIGSLTEVLQQTTARLARLEMATK